MEFKDLYQQTPDDTKLNFLESLLSQNKTLQEQFVRCLEASKSPDDSFSLKDFSGEAEANKNLYISLFEAVDLEDPDFDHYVPPHSGYLEEWEVYQIASEQELDKVFEQVKTNAVDFVIRHQPDKLLAMLIGLLDAVRDTDMEDPYDSFGDVHEYLLEQFDYTMNSIVEKVKLAPLGESVIKPAWTLFFDYCDQEHSVGIGFAKSFEPLLMALAEKCNSSDKLLSVLDQSFIKRENLPLLTLLLLEKSQDKDGWLEAAKHFYTEDDEVARQLLRHYYENDPGTFRELSRELFKKEKSVWASFLQDYVSSENDQELYIDVFFELTVENTDITYYKKIRNLLSDTQKNALIEKAGWKKPFVTQILSVEERYEDIKIMIESGCYQWDFHYIIAPILEIYPAFCFREITQRVYEVLTNSRGRSSYQIICNWLRLSQKIPGFINEKQEVISNLYHHKPNLPALKDELRKAGLAN
jgi:hypothetical protein